MADFLIADKIVRGLDDGYANNPIDRGGETYAGISRIRWPHADIWTRIDAMKSMRNFPDNLRHKQLAPMVAIFYQRNFWNRINASLYPNQLIANQVYDMAVNMGVKRAGIHLQRTLNLLNRRGQDYPDIVVNGVIGRKTIEALKSYLMTRGGAGVHTLGFYLLVQMGSLWVKLASNDQSQEDFMSGWGKRGLLTALQYSKHFTGEES